jgi:hypothetical protein
MSLSPYFALRARTRQEKEAHLCAWPVSRGRKRTQNPLDQDGRREDARARAVFGEAGGRM